MQHYKLKQALLHAEKYHLDIKCVAEEAAQTLVTVKVCTGAKRVGGQVLKLSRQSDRATANSLSLLCCLIAFWN